MSITNELKRKVHHGRNIKRFREMMGLKQEGLAMELGGDWNQRKVSLLEAKDEIDAELIKQVSRVLKVPAEFIENFDEESTVLNIQNNNDSSAPTINFPNQCTFNPLDKYIEAIEKNEKLYEALLKSEREKVELLQKMLDSRS